MPRHPVPSMHADRRDLACMRPHAGVAAVATCLDAHLAECHDERFLDLAQVPVQVLAVSLEVEDGVAHQLSGAVEGDVAAALDFVHLDAARAKPFGRGDDVRLLRRATEGDDRRMLEQQQDVFVDLPGDAAACEIALELQGDRVGDGAELRDQKLHSAGSEGTAKMTEFRIQSSEFRLPCLDSEFCILNSVIFAASTITRESSSPSSPAPPPPPPPTAWGEREQRARSPPPCTRSRARPRARG